MRFAEAIYVVHAFQKKSTQGRATSKRDIALIEQRLRQAAEEYQRLYGGGNS